MAAEPIYMLGAICNIIAADGSMSGFGMRCAEHRHAVLVARGTLQTTACFIFSPVENSTVYRAVKLATPSDRTVTEVGPFDLIVFKPGTDSACMLDELNEEEGRYWPSLFLGACDGEPVPVDPDEPESKRIEATLVANQFPIPPVGENVTIIAPIDRSTTVRVMASPDFVNTPVDMGPVVVLDAVGDLVGFSFGSGVPVTMLTADFRYQLARAFVNVEPAMSERAIAKTEELYPARPTAEAGV
jgi:hypothetical protein